MAKTVYKNAKIFTKDADNSFFESGYICVEGSRIVELGPMRGYKKPDAANEVDLNGMVVLPGMIHSHSHFYGQFVRGMALNASPRNWHQILSDMWWKVDKKLDAEQSYYSAMMGLIEGIEAGTTTYIDHQASPFHSIGSLSQIERAVRETGARAVLAYEVTDRDGKALRDNGIRENVAFIKAHPRNSEDRVKGTFGLHASYTLDDETLERCVAEAKALDAGFHLHVAEDCADVADSYRRCNKHVVERLNDFGILGEKTVAAHCVHVGPEEWSILRDTGTMVAHNCQSNSNNAVGISPVHQMLQDGVCVALGGDGYIYDSFKELSVAIAVQRIGCADPRVMGSDLLDKLVFENNFRIAGTFFDGIGALKAGNYADFIAIDYHEPTPLLQNNLYAHLTSGFSGNVHTVVINGNVVLKNRELVHVDKQEVFAKCREQAQRLWKSIV